MLESDEPLDIDTNVEECHEEAETCRAGSDIDTSREDRRLTLKHVGGDEYSQGSNGLRRDDV